MGCYSIPNCFWLQSFKIPWFQSPPTRSDLPYTHYGYYGSLCAKAEGCRGTKFPQTLKDLLGKCLQSGRRVAPVHRPGGDTKTGLRNVENWNDKWINVTLSFQLSKNGNPDPLSQLIEWNWNPDPKWGGFCFFF